MGSGIQGLSRIVSNFYSQFNPQQHHHQQQQNMFTIKINGIFFTSFFFDFLQKTTTKKQPYSYNEFGCTHKGKRLSIFLVHVTCFYVLEPMKPKISPRNQTTLSLARSLLCQCTRIGNADERHTSTHERTQAHLPFTTTTFTTKSRALLSSQSISLMSSTMCTQ